MSRECPIGNWKRLGKRWRTRRIIFNTVQNAKKPHPAGSENTAIPQFEIKITEIPQEKLSDTAIPQTLMSPSVVDIIREIAAWVDMSQLHHD